MEGLDLRPHPNLRIRSSDPAQPIILSTDYTKLILVAAHGCKLPCNFRCELLLKKSNMDRNARLAIFRENPCPAYCGDFFCSAHEGINIIAERCFEVLGYARFKLAGILHRARKNYIPARE